MHEDFEMDNLEPHVFADLFPIMTGKAFDELVVSIANVGLIEPIILFEGKILDGRNRYAAAKAAGMEFDRELHFRCFEGTEEEALAYVTAINLNRRHLTSSQRAMAAAVIANLERGGRGQGDASVTVQQAGESLSVSPFLVKAARRVRRTAASHIIAMVERGTLSVAAAEVIGGLPTHRQAQLSTPAQAEQAATRIRQARGAFGRYTAARLLVTVGELGEEIGDRGIATLAAAADAHSLPRVNAALEQLSELRTAILVAQSAPAPADATS